MNSQFGAGTPPPSKYNIVIKNVSGETLPPYSCVAIGGATAVGSRPVYSAAIPSGAEGATHAFTAGEQLLPDKVGVATTLWPAVTQVDSTVASGGECGPLPLSTALSGYGKGFTCLGDAYNGRARVAPRGTTQGDDFPLVRFLGLQGVVMTAGAIVGYGIPVDPPPASLARVPTFVAAKPRAGSPFAVALTTIPFGGLGDAGPIGVLACRIDIRSERHPFATAITDNVNYLASAKSGPAVILWYERQAYQGPSKLGVQWARILLLGDIASVEVYRGITLAKIAAATGDLGDNMVLSSGNVRLYDPPVDDASNTWTMGEVVQADNWMHGDIDTHKPVELRKVRNLADGSTLYGIIAEGCTKVKDKQTS